MLDPIILLVLHRNPSHGYSIMEAMETYGSGHLDISILYRKLHQMEDLGWVTSSKGEGDSQGPPRRVYTITDEGEEILHRYMADLENHIGNLQRIVEDYKKHMRHHNSEREE